LFRSNLDGYEGFHGASGTFSTGWRVSETLPMNRTVIADGRPVGTPGGVRDVPAAALYETGGQPPLSANAASWDEAGAAVGRRLEQGPSRK
jgi:hypothetical protein